MTSARARRDPSIEKRARGLRRRPVDPDTARFNERVAEGLRLTGDVIRWMRTGERPGEDVQVARRARVGRLVEEIGLAWRDWVR